MGKAPPDSSMQLLRVKSEKIVSLYAHVTSGHSEGLIHSGLRED